jgi:hypothetical protein
MTQSDHEIALEKRFDSYRQCKRERAWYAAGVQLAEILHLSASLPFAQQAAWKTRVENEELTQEFLREIRHGLRKKIERTHRILAIGTEWSADEVFLVMNLRVEIKLVSDFLEDGVEPEMLGQLRYIDDQLASLETSHDHSLHFQRGFRQLKKHWFDIEPIWSSIFTSETPWWSS